MAGNRQPLASYSLQTVVATALLRQLYAVVVSGRLWGPHVATHGTRQAAVREVVAA